MQKRPRSQRASEGRVSLEATIVSRRRLEDGVRTAVALSSLLSPSLLASALLLRVLSDPLLSGPFPRRVLRSAQ